MSSSPRLPDKKTAEHVLAALACKVSTDDLTRIVTAYSNDLEGFDNVYEEWTARGAFFDQILMLLDVDPSRIQGLNIEDHTSIHLEYYCQITDFSLFVPKILSQAITDDSHQLERADYYRLTTGHLSDEISAKERIKNQPKAPLKNVEGFSLEGIQAGPSATSASSSQTGETSKKNQGKVAQKRKTDPEIKTHAQLLAEIATVTSGAASILLQPPNKDSELDPSGAKNPKMETNHAMKAQKSSIDPSNKLDYLVDTIQIKENIGKEIEDELEEMDVETLRKLSPEPEKRKPKGISKEYSTKQGRNLDPADNALPYCKEFGRAQAVVDIAQELQAKTATPNSEAPTVKASRTSNHKVLAYRITEDDMGMFEKNKEELTQEENRRIAKWLNDGLTHAISVPASFTSATLFKYMHADLTPNQISVMVTRVNDSLTLLDFKERMLSGKPIIAGTTPEEFLASRELSDLVAIDSLVTCVGPVIDYIHSSVEEMRANNEVPRKDLEQLYHRTCAKLDNHAGSYQHLTDQVAVLVEKTSKMSMDDLAKGMVNNPSNRRSTMSGLSSSSGPSTPHSNTMGPPASVGLVRAAARKVENEEKVELRRLARLAMKKKA